MPGPLRVIGAPRSTVRGSGPGPGSQFSRPFVPADVKINVLKKMYFFPDHFHLFEGRGSLRLGRSSRSEDLGQVVQGARFEPVRAGDLGPGAGRFWNWSAGHGPA